MDPFWIVYLYGFLTAALPIILGFPIAYFLNKKANKNIDDYNEKTDRKAKEKFKQSKKEIEVKI